MSNKSKSTIVITKLSKKPVNVEHDDEKENKPVRAKRVLQSLNTEYQLKQSDDLEIKKAKISKAVVEEEEQEEKSWINLFDKDKNISLGSQKQQKLENASEFRSNLDMIDELLGETMHESAEKASNKTDIEDSSKIEDLSAKTDLDESSKVENATDFGLFTDDESEIEPDEAETSKKSKRTTKSIVRIKKQEAESASKLDKSKRKVLDESSKIYDFKAEKDSGLFDESEQESETADVSKKSRSRLRAKRAVVKVDSSSGDESEPKLLKTKKRSTAVKKEKKEAKPKRVTKKQLEQNKKNEELEKYLIEEAKRMEAVKNYKLIVETVDRDYDY